MDAGAAEDQRRQTNSGLRTGKRRRFRASCSTDCDTGTKAVYKLEKAVDDGGFHLAR